MNIHAPRLCLDLMAKMKRQHPPRLIRPADKRFSVLDATVDRAAVAPAHDGFTGQEHERACSARATQDSTCFGDVAPQAAHAREVISALLGCWPEPALAVARRVGVSKAELDAWLAGKGVLPGEALSHLMTIFGLTFLHGEQCGQEADARSPVTIGEHYVLLAGNASERTATGYDFLIGKDPAAASVELVPAGRAPGHRWRYLMIVRQSDVPSLICFPRIGRSARMLDNGKLTRFLGRLAVNPNFYDTVQALRADLEQRPTRVLEAMHGLYTQCATDIEQIGVQMRHIAD